MKIHSVPMKRILAALTFSMLSACSSGTSAPATPAPQAPGSAPQASAPYICPMECKRPGENEPFTQAQPGSCPVCGMALHQAPAAR